MSNTKFDLREDQEDDFKKLNLEIVAATNPPDATVEVLDEMYAGGVTHQITDFVVPGWRGTTSAANQEAMYRGVIAPSCRACHNSLASNITWNTAAQMEVKRFVTQHLVCRTHQMPHAVETHNSFWLSSTPHQPLVVRDFLTALNGGATLGSECTP